jgi:hypothetical protein
VPKTPLTPRGRRAGATLAKETGKASASG